MSETEMPSDATTPTAGIDDRDARASEKRRFAVNVAIFLTVNVAVLIAWAGLVVFGVHTRGLWVWPIVVALWAVRLGLEGRVAYGRADRRRRTYSEERIRRELKRMS